MATPAQQRKNAGGVVRSAGLEYSPPLDGIRGIAIAAVLVFHIVPAFLPGGFTGVDVFFVLSGFLIASIILHDIRERRFSLKEFYLRRIQRIVPNIVITVLAVLLLSCIVLPPSSRKEVARSGIYTLTNLSNYFIWRNLGGYWGNSAESAPLLHTWSLAVEEQFYFLFPAYVLLLAKFRGRSVARGLVAAGVLSLGLCIWATGGHPVAAFYFLPTRLWELLLGAALAAGRSPRQILDGSSEGPVRWKLEYAAIGTPFAEARGVIGLTLVIAGFFLIDEKAAFPGAAALIPTVGTVLVLTSVGAGTWISRFLDSPFLVWTGKLSYSLYLWHWPLIVYGRLEAERHGEPPLAGAIAAGIASVALAWLGYKAVEQPLRSRAAGRKWRLATIAAGFGFAMLASVWVARSLPEVDVAPYFDPPEFRGLAYNAGKPSGEDYTRAIRYRDVRFTAVSPRHPSWSAGGIIHSFGTRDPQVVVFGSSHALMYSSVIDSICEKRGLSVAFLGADGVPMFPNAAWQPQFMTQAEMADLENARKRWLEVWHPRVLFVIDRWDMYADETRFSQELRSFLEEATGLAKTVQFVAQVPVIANGGHDVNLREFMAWRAGRGAGFPPVFPDRYAMRRSRLLTVAREAMAQFPNLRIARPDYAFLKPDGSLLWASGRTVYYADDNHLAQAGAELAREVFQQAIAEACPL